LYNLYNLDKMPKKKKNSGNSVRLSVSVSKAERHFIEENQLSPTKLLKWALEQKGFENKK